MVDEQTPDFEKLESELAEREQSSEISKLVAEHYQNLKKTRLADDPSLVAGLCIEYQRMMFQKMNG